MKNHRDCSGPPVKNAAFVETVKRRDGHVLRLAKKLFLRVSHPRHNHSRWRPREPPASGASMGPSVLEDARGEATITSYYAPYHGHDVRHLGIALRKLREKHDSVVFFAGDS